MLRRQGLEPRPLVKSPNPAAAARAPTLAASRTRYGVQHAAGRPAAACWEASVLHLRMALVAAGAARDRLLGLQPTVCTVYGNGPDVAAPGHTPGARRT